MQTGNKLLQELRSKLVPGKTTFAKLTEEHEPYLFEQLAVDTRGMMCVYYSFHLKDGTPVKKRLILKEFEAAVKTLADTGSLTRQDFAHDCPNADATGPCGFAVAGRILEMLRLARYAGRGRGFEQLDNDLAEQYLHM